MLLFYRKENELRLLQVVECPAGGVLRYMIDLCNVLSKNGVEIDIVYSLREETPLDLESQFPENVHLHHIKMCREITPMVDMRALIKLWGIFKETKPDIIHAHSSKAGVLTRFAARLAGAKKVYYTPHGYSFIRSDVSDKKRKIFLLLEKAASAMGGITIASSNMELEQAKNFRLGETTDLFHCVPIFGQTYRNGGKKRSSSICRIGTSGRISAQKNPSGFLEVCHEMNKMIPNLEFVWIGDGELRGELESGSKELGIDIRITGWLQAETAVKKMAELDLYLHTALWEAWPPYTVMEAMALGIPVAAFDVDGVTDDVYGAVSTAGDYKSMAGKAGMILQNNALWSRNSSKGLKVIKDYYSMEVFARRANELYFTSGSETKKEQSDDRLLRVS
jgi:glycosyltransferase involved in cell wall biosynthesis